MNEIQEEHRETLTLKVREVGQPYWEAVPGLTYSDMETARQGAGRLFAKLNKTSAVNFHVAIAGKHKDGAK